MEKILAIAILNLQKEMNIGSIIRTANAAAVSEVIIVGRKKWNKSAATGAYRSIPIKRIKTTDEFLEYCNQNEYDLVSLEISEDSKDLFEYNYPKKAMLVIGNEGSGIPEKILSKSKDILIIHQYGDVECLNVAVSASIAIYDWVRKEQKNYKKEITDHKFS